MTSQNLYRKTRLFVGSNLFFYSLLGLFIFGCFWVAFSAHYPMAFDENYHYGIIQQYSHQLSPFFSHPPLDTEKFGDITRYPSYLYHYLLSFPYRFASVFSSSDQVRIIILRLLNISFFVGALVYFKRLLVLSGAGKALANLTLLFFTLIPNVIFLAAHINYDNLLILLTAAILYYCLQFILGAKKGQFEADLIIKITTLNLLTTLVVFTHLPVFFATQIFIIGYGFLMAKKRKRNLIKDLVRSFRAWLGVSRWMWSGLLVLGLGLFLERYGYNQLKYHNLIPDCAQILSQKSCMQYGPWGRDFKLEQLPPSSWSNARYFLQWAGQNMYELFFTINYNYVNKTPLILPFITAWLIAIFGSIATLLSWPKLKKNISYVFFAFVIAVYVISLWKNNLNRFHNVGAPVAIHGRYWMQLLPIILILIALGIKLTLQRLPRLRYYQTSLVLLLVATILSLQGGSISSYIIASNADWYWPNKTITTINLKAQSVLTKVIVH